MNVARAAWWGSMPPVLARSNKHMQNKIPLFIHGFRLGSEVGWGAPSEFFFFSSFRHERQSCIEQRGQGERYVYAKRYRLFTAFTITEAGVGTD